jgi:predicted DNA-binding transcriptional regulator YafY
MRSDSRRKSPGDGACPGAVTMAGMRRADRLFRIVQLLRAGRLTTARTLARKLEVSERTIYRDVRDLQLSGMPIEGEAGVGYTLRRDFDIPPLMFSREEITALVLGARMVRAWGGTEMTQAAGRALEKIEAVLPPVLRDALDETRVYAPGFRIADEMRSRLDVLHQAALDRHCAEFAYQREDGDSSQRRVRPLALCFWGGVWTLVSWCELRRDFRSFRVDRMQALAVSTDQFALEPGKTLVDFLARVVPPGTRLPL